MHAVQFYQIKSVKAGGGIEQQQPGDNEEAAARHEVQSQLHGDVSFRVDPQIRIRIYMGTTAIS